jgi:hypothetical protein
MELERIGVFNLIVWSQIAIGMCPAFLSAMEQIIFECLYVALG